MPTKKNLKKVNLFESFKQGGTVRRHQSYLPPPSVLQSPNVYEAGKAVVQQVKDVQNPSYAKQIAEILKNDPTLTLGEAIDKTGKGDVTDLMGLTQYVPGFLKDKLPEDVKEFSRLRNSTALELLNDDWFMENYGDDIMRSAFESSGASDVISKKGAELFEKGAEAFGDAVKGFTNFLTPKPPVDTVDVKQVGGVKKKDPNREYDNTVSESGKTGYAEIREENTSIPNPNEGALTYQYDAEQTPTSNMSPIVDLRYMPTDYMSSSNPSPVASSGQTRPPVLFSGNAAGFPLRAGTEGANPELYIGVADAKFNPQALYQGQAIVPSVGLRAEAAYDRSLTPEVREDIFRYTGANISPINTRFNPYIEVSGPRGNTVTGGVSFGGQVNPGGPGGLSYNVGYRKNFAQGGLFQNPILSMLDMAKEAGDEMVQSELNDMFSASTEDILGFNFVPRDENGVVIEIIFKGQEGGYSRNQDTVEDKAVSAVGAGAGFFGSAINAAIEAAKKANEGKTESTPTEDPVKLTPAQTNALNISSAIDKVAGDNQDLRALLYTTAYMENTFGANPNAYGRDYTHSFMSLDDPAINQIFDVREGGN